jgi:hypothetical protein
MSNLYQSPITSDTSEVSKSKQIFLNAKKEFKNVICDIKSSKKSNFQSISDAQHGKTKFDFQNYVNIEVNKEPKNPMNQEADSKTKYDFEEILGRFEEYYYTLTFINREYLLEVFFCLNYLHGMGANVEKLTEVYQNEYSNFMNHLTMENNNTNLMPNSISLECTL